MTTIFHRRLFLMGRGREIGGGKKKEQGGEREGGSKSAGD